MGRKRTNTCKDCQNLCPFIDENNNGNCILDLKEVNLDMDWCDKFKKNKENIFK